MNTYGKAYVAWFLHHNRKRLATYCGVLFVLFVLPACMIGYDPRFFSMPLEWACVFLLAGGIALAMGLPIYLFQYLWKQRSADLYLPLPMSKRQLFFIHYVLGLCLSALPIVMFLIAAALREESRAFYPYLALFAIGIYLITSASYSLYVFAVVKCNSLWDAWIAVLGYALLQILLASTIDWMLSNVVHQVLSGSGSVTEFFPIRGIEVLLSPILACTHWLDGVSTAVFVQSQNAAVLPVWENLFAQNHVQPLLFLTLLILSGAACLGACYSYEHRKGEDSEQKTTSKWIYPLLIFAITACMLFVTSASMSTLWITLIVFLILNFAAERKITLRLSRIAGFLAMMLCGVALFWVMVQTKGFHLIHEYYSPQEIQDITFYLYLHEETEELPIPSLPSLQENNEDTRSVELREPVGDAQFIEWMLKLQHESAEANGYESSIGYIQINFALKNGKTANRGYTIDETQMHTLAAIMAYLQEKNVELIFYDD